MTCGALLAMQVIASARNPSNQGGFRLPHSININSKKNSLDLDTASIFPSKLILVE
jgi:hypothetical protein